MVSIGENAVRHYKANHAVTHYLLKSFGQVFGEGVGDGFNDFLSVFRQLRDIFFGGLDGGFGHVRGFGVKKLLIKNQLRLDLL
jgi:hypothetical protein